MKIKTLKEIERLAIVDALTRHSGNVRQVALELDVTRGALYQKMTRYGIELPGFRAYASDKKIGGAT